MVLGTYLTVAQVSETVDQRAAALDKKDAAESAKLKAFSALIQGKEVTERQKEMEQVKIDGLKELQKNGIIGEINHVRKGLTFVRVGGAVVGALGLMGVFLNGLMNAHQPMQLHTNKAMFACMGASVLGFEVSGGLGGVLPKPSSVASRALQNMDEYAQGKDSEEDKARELYETAFEKDVLRYPKASRLYYEFADQINVAYREKSAKTHNAEVELSMEEMGLDWKAIEKDFRPLDKAETEKVLSRWVSRMAKEGGDWKSVESQKEFVSLKGKRETKYHLPEFTPIDSEVAQSYSLPPEPNKP